MFYLDKRIQGICDELRKAEHPSARPHFRLDVQERQFHSPRGRAA